MRTDEERSVQRRVEIATGVRYGDNTEKDPHNWVSGDDPMTGAQASYLKTLAEQAHVRVPNQAMTKAEASELIDEMRSKANIKM